MDSSSTASTPPDPTDAAPQDPEYRSTVEMDDHAIDPGQVDEQDGSDPAAQD